MADNNPIPTHLHRLLESRAYPKTICPSEVARALSASELRAVGASDWRDLMPEIRERVWDMRDRDEVEILQRGEVLGREVRIGDVRGPIRVRKTLGSGAETAL